MFQYQKYQDWKEGLPDLKWLDEVLPDNEKWQQFRGSLIQLKDSVAESIEIGTKIYFFINIYIYFISSYHRVRSLFADIF